MFVKIRRWCGLLCVFVLALVVLGGACADPVVPGETTPDSAVVDGTVAEQSSDTTTPQDRVSPPETRQEGKPEVRIEKQPEAPGRTCEQKPPLPLGKGFFVDISVASGAQAGNYIKDFTKKIPINDHSRLGFADINGDGYDDIVGHSLFPNPQAGVPFTHVILLNNGDGTFRDFSKESGLGDVQAGFFAFADVDNDGDQDCFAGLDIRLGAHRNQIYLNDGKGHFTLKPNAGVSDQSLLAANALFADFNNDAKLDLYVGAGGTSAAVADALFFGKGDGTFTRQTQNLAGNVPRPSNGSVTCDYDNDGDLDIIVSTYGVSVALGHNVLWQNDGKGNFTNVARATGFEAQATGNYLLNSTNRGKDPEPNKVPGQYVGSNGFGVDCKDVNNDGLYDIFLTAISHPNEGTYSRKWSDPSQLMINGGLAKKYAFTNQFSKWNLPFNEGDVDGALHDFDNDGRLDVSVSRDNKYEGSYTTFEQKAWFGLYHQQDNSRFRSVSGDSGINVLDPKDSASLTLCDGSQPCPTGEECLLKRCRQACTKSSDCKSKDDICGSYWDTATSKVIKICRSAVKMKGAQNHAWADIDRDGDLDLLVGGRDKGGGRPNFLFRNDIGSKNRWMALKLVGDGVKVNRDAIGARVSFQFKTGKVMSREVQSSRGMYNSMDSRTLHFGLASFSCDYSIVVRWPNGEKVTIPLSKLAENKYSTITYPDQVK